MNSRILLFFAILLIIGCAQKEIIEKDISKEDGQMKITSPVFQNNGNIPSKYTCQGEDINPELNIEGIPENAKSLVLIMDDPDAPVGVWDHWVLFNISMITKINEDSVPQGAVQGKNSWEKNGYGGPCPPSGTHRYIFKLYALDATLDIGSSSDKNDVEQEMRGHILSEAKLVGLYSKG